MGLIGSRHCHCGVVAPNQTCKGSVRSEQHMRLNKGRRRIHEGCLRFDQEVEKNRCGGPASSLARLPGENRKSPDRKPWLNPDREERASGTLRNKPQSPAATYKNARTRLFY
jgi:hypothetical protein